MFPIPWNFPFRKKNGNLVNIGDAIDEGTELPEHGEGDAGKVLSVDENGDLEWADAPTEIPDFDSSDEGKVLSVDENGDLEWSDDVNTEIQTISDKLDDEIETRAKVGVHNFFTTRNPGGRGPYTNWTAEDNGIRLSNSESSTYCYQQFNQNLQKNTDYIISVDITVASGSAGIVIKGDSTNILTQLNISGSVKYTFNTGNYDTITITFYSATDTAAVGNVLYDNLLVKLATDNYENYQSYAMTNKELTDVAQQVEGNYIIKVDKTNSLVSVTADGVKTYGTLLSDLRTALLTYMASHLDEYYEILGADTGAGLLDINLNAAGLGKIYHSGDNLRLRFYGFAFADDGANMRIIDVSSTSSSYKRYFISQSQYTATDSTDSIASSGTVLALHIRIYTKVQ